MDQSSILIEIKKKKKEIYTYALFEQQPVERRAFFFSRGCILLSGLDLRYGINV